MERIIRKLPSLELLTGLTISHVWIGHGSALFLELGILSERIKRDGSIGNPQGEITVIVDFDWRVERKKSIMGGSHDERKHCIALSCKLLGAMIKTARVVGRIPELEIELSNNLWVSTFSHDKGQPTWAVMFKALKLGTLCVKRGCLVLDERALHFDSTSSQHRSSD